MVRMSYRMNLLAAVTLPVADKLRAIPPEFWFKALIAVVGLVVVVILLRKVTHMNKAIAAVVVLLALTFVGFNWIFERNEPRWATPAVSWLSGFFPTRGSYGAKQHTPSPIEAPAMAKRK